MKHEMDVSSHGTPYWWCKNCGYTCDSLTKAEIHEGTDYPKPDMKHKVEKGGTGYFFCLGCDFTCQTEWEAGLHEHDTKEPRKRMKIDTKVYEKLCQCELSTCSRPHTFVELQKELGSAEYMAFMQTISRPEAKCPKCSNPATVYAFNGEWLAFCQKCQLALDILEDGKITIAEEDDTDFDFTEETMKPEPKADCPTCNRPITSIDIYQCDGEWEAYCDICSINFIVETGKIIDYTKVPSKNSKKKGKKEEKKEEKPKTHLMSFNKNLKEGKQYICDTCKYQTDYVNNANNHEKLLVTDDPHYTVFVITDRWDCIFCGKSFNVWKEALAHENDIGKRAYNWTSSYTNSYTSTHCVHKPTHVIDGKDENWHVYVGRKYDCDSKSTLNDFDIILNLSGSKLDYNRHIIPFKRLKKWESVNRYQEIFLNWPDHGVTELPAEFWRDLTAMMREQGKARVQKAEEESKAKGEEVKPVPYKMLIFCIGGHGRTGTALASLLTSELGMEPDKACVWVWENYCKEAIETNSQINYVYELAGKTYVPPKEDKKDDKKGSQAIMTYGMYGSD